MNPTFDNGFPGEPHRGGKLSLPTLLQKEQSAFLPQRLVEH